MLARVRHRLREPWNFSPIAMDGGVSQTMAPRLVAFAQSNLHRWLQMLQKQPSVGLPE